MTDEEIKALLGGKRGAVVEIDDQEIVIAEPTRAEFDRWSDSDKQTQATRVLVKSCVVHPDRGALDAILDKYPALVKTELASAVAELAGLGKAKRRMV